MKKINIIVLSALLVLGLAFQVRAEQSPSSATGTRYYDNQVFTMAYNNSGSDISSNNVVILDISGTDVADETTLGAYITTTTTADSVYVFGVTHDPNCVAGTSCRVCIRGPHKVMDTDSTHANGAILSTSTTAISLPFE